MSVGFNFVTYWLVHTLIQVCTERSGNFINVAMLYLRYIRLGQNVAKKSGAYEVMYYLNCTRTSIANVLLLIECYNRN